MMVRWMRDKKMRDEMMRNKWMKGKCMKDKCIKIKSMLAVTMVVCVLLSILPVRDVIAASQKFTMKDHFVQALQYFSGEPYAYTRYALHDFDGDDIPELLLGTANENNPLYTTYDVLKFDTIGKRFVKLGDIAQSRYLMKDRYSNALIGLYEDNINGRVFKIYRNYYIANNTISRNIPLAYLGNTNTSVIYDGFEIAPGYYRNDIKIDKNTFEQEELCYRGSYDELIVHDMRGFNYEVAYIAVYSWTPTVFVKRPIRFTSADVFTKVWQKPMYDLIKSKCGPANTKIDAYKIDTTLYKERYQRYALYDIDSDSIPELFLAVQRDERLAFDVYKYWDGEMRFVGSFNGYSKYLAKVKGASTPTRSGDVFSFDIVWDDLYNQSANRISFKNNAIKNDSLLVKYYHTKNQRFMYNVLSSDGIKLVETARDNYVKLLNNYVVNYEQIRTFDIDMTPPSGPLIMYVKTQAFTLQ